VYVYYEEAGQFKNSFAFYYLSICYFSSKFVKRNFIRNNKFCEEVLGWNDDLDSILILYLEYNDGIGVKRDNFQSIEFVIKLISKNYYCSFIQYQLFLLNGEFIEWNDKKVVFYFKNHKKKYEEDRLFWYRFCFIERINKEKNCHLGKDEIKNLLNNIYFK
jgi:hypothetical protein